MRMDRFTTLAQEILSSAQSLAMGKGHAEMTPLHMLVAMLDSADSFAHSVLEKAGFDSARIEQVANSVLNRKPTISGTAG